jgi:hypothetical protein
MQNYAQSNNPFAVTFSNPQAFQAATSQTYIQPLNFPQINLPPIYEKRGVN